jgi:WD40 repeat protein
MRSRKLELPNWSEDDRLDVHAKKMSTGSRRLPFWTGELFLVAIVIACAVVIYTAVFSEKLETTGRMTLAGHTQPIESVTFSPDGKTLASCGWDASVRLWDLSALKRGAAKREPVVLPHESVRFAAAFSPDGTLLAAAGHRSLTIWSCASGQFKPKFEKEGETYRCLAFSPDGRTLALGGDDGSVRLWDTSTGRERAAIRAHGDVVRSLAFSPDGRRLVSSGQDNQIILWDAVHDTCIRPLSHPGYNPVHIVAFSPDGGIIAVGEVAPSAADVVFLDPETGKILGRLPGRGLGINALVFSPDGRALATAGMDRCIKLWDVKSGKEQTALQDDVGWVKSLAFSADGVWLAFPGRDYTVRIWDVSRKQSQLVGEAPAKA